MRRFIFIFLVSLFSTFSVKAETQATFFAQAYEKVRSEYLYENVSVAELSMAALNGLLSIDNKLKFSDNEYRLTIYYDGKSYMNIIKPTAVNDYSAWGEFTEKVIKAAEKTSPKVKARNFEIEDYCLLSMFSALDSDSQYYPYLDLGEKRNSKKQRYFAERYLADDVLYMKFGILNLYTKEAIVKSLEDHPNYKALIIDLRGNKGGLLSEAVSVMKIFLDEGVIVSVKGKDVTKHDFYVADGTNLVKNKPIIVLVDGDTASAAEVLASALYTQLNAKLVGTRTKGKGTVQDLIEFSNGGEAAITTGLYYIANGDSIQKVGIKPAFCTSGISGNENVDEVYANVSNLVRACEAESREASELDIKIAQEMLKN